MNSENFEAIFTEELWNFPATTTIWSVGLPKLMVYPNLWFYAQIVKSTPQIRVADKKLQDNGAILHQTFEQCKIVQIFAKQCFKSTAIHPLFVRQEI